MDAQTSLSAHPTANARGPLSTSRQRLHIRCLLRQLELDTRRATLFHRRFWTAAQLPEPALGTDLDAYLSALSRQQASALAAVIAKEVPREDE